MNRKRYHKLITELGGGCFLFLAVGQNSISDQIGEQIQCDSSLCYCFFPDLLPCNPKLSDTEVEMMNLPKAGIRCTWQ